MMKTALLIDLYSGKTEVLPQEEITPATAGLLKVETEAAVTFKGEEYMVVVLK